MCVKERTNSPAICIDTLTTVLEEAVAIPNAARQHALLTFASMASSFACFSFSCDITLSNSDWAVFSLKVE